MHPATVDAGETFFARRFPEAPAIADPDHVLYTGFGLTRGSLVRVAGPSVWLPTIRSLLAGNGGSGPIGDALLLAGFFVVRGDQVLWSQRTTTSAEPARWDEMLTAAR